MNRNMNIYMAGMLLAVMAHAGNGGPLLRTADGYRDILRDGITTAHDYRAGVEHVYVVLDAPAGRVLREKLTKAGLSLLELHSRVTGEYYTYIAA